MQYVAGVDEAGRGPLAGPVVAAAVVLSPGSIIADLNDSKLLSSKKRIKLFDHIKAQAIGIGVGICSVAEIEKLNILQATLLAMNKAVTSLSIEPQLVLVDGNVLPKWSFNSRAIIKGDQKEPVISAASIIAKVTRDNIMLSLDREYPQYGFAKHKGYGTKEHINAILKHGAITEHRNNFLKKILA